MYWESFWLVPCKNFLSCGQYFCRCGQLECFLEVNSISDSLICIALTLSWLLRVGSTREKVRLIKIFLIFKINNIQK